MLRLMLLLCLFLCPKRGEAAQIFAAPESPLRIGSGLDAASHQWRTPCLDGSVQPSAANRSLTIKMYDSQSAEEILEDQRGYGSAQVDFWVVGAKARSEFILRNSESSTQTSLMWSLEYRAASLTLQQRQLNARGRQAEARSPAEQSELCGDQFILSAVLGARFYLAASLVFDSQEQYRLFKTKASASAFGGLLKKEKTSIDELQKIAGGAHLSVQAIQYGGQTFDLDLIAASQVSYCPIENLDPCLERFAALHRYAFGPNGFRLQSATQKPEQLAVLWLLASSYQDAGHFLRRAPTPELRDPGFIALSERLFQWNGQVQQKIARVSSRVWDASQSSETREQAKQDLLLLQKKAEAINEAAEACLREVYGNCRKRLDSLGPMVASP